VTVGHINAMQGNLQNLNTIKVAGNMNMDGPIFATVMGGNTGVDTDLFKAMLGKLQNLETTTLLVGGN